MITECISLIVKGTVFQETAFQKILILKGVLALEIGRGQYFSVAKVLEESNFRQIRIMKDYQNNIRCIFSTL